MTDRKETEDGGAVELAGLPAMADAATKIAEVLLPLTNAQRFRVLSSMVVLYGVRATRRIVGVTEP